MACGGSWLCRRQSASALEGGAGGGELGVRGGAACREVDPGDVQLHARAVELCLSDLEVRLRLVAGGGD
jgi:hypothetical protein